MSDNYMYPDPDYGKPRDLVPEFARQTLIYQLLTG
jgi:hypothetical protein